MMKHDMHVLVSGASIAGLTTAYWMRKLGYKVTIVEIADGLRQGGTAVDIKGETVDVVKRMGIFDQVKANRLTLERWDFKNAEDVTERSTVFFSEGEERPDDAFEIERDTFMNILFDTVKHDVALLFNNRITSLDETGDAVHVTFKDGSQHPFDLVMGCDGIHSAVRRLAFGNEAEYTHFLGLYFSVTIVNKLLIKRNTGQLYSVLGKSVMLNAYKDKTDIILFFVSENEIPYDYRDEAQQRTIMLDQFAGQSWRVAELLEEVKASKTFYFDKLCQIRMPSWTKGRVALVGDAAYCASPAAGMGASLAMDGAAALTDALQHHNGNHALAFEDYNKKLRPFIEGVQADAIRFALELVPRTEEAVHKMYLGTGDF